MAFQNTGQVIGGLGGGRHVTGRPVVHPGVQGGEAIAKGRKAIRRAGITVGHGSGHSN